MTVEVLPMGYRCNLGCTYCYQNPMRDGDNLGSAYNVEAMKRALLEENQSFTIFGGEALLTPIEVLRELWQLGLDKWGQNGLQTNGALITNAHIEDFKRYKVHVGFSLDGPEELNDQRWAGSKEKTREATARSQAALEQLLAEGIGASLIATLHRLNASTPELRARMKEWFRGLHALGMTNARLHALEIDHPAVRAKLGMANTQKIEAFLDFAAFERDLAPNQAQQRLRFDVFTDIEKSLGGNMNVTCVWHACDPYTTSAVRGVDGQGNRSNCGRTNKDGVSWLKAQQSGHERQLALYNTPQELGGCQGCRFFTMCSGQCPGTAIDGDWRNRSEDCELYKALFEHVEREFLTAGKVPLSLAPDRLQREQQYLNVFAAGTDPSHGDHTDSGGKDHNDSDHGDYSDHGDSNASQQGHNDSGHGDYSDHGDSDNGHGDHTDAQRAVLELPEGMKLVVPVRPARGNGAAQV